MVKSMNTNERILQLLRERNWTEYRLAKESGLSQSTISNLFKRNTTPSIPTLESICNGFGITLSQFFSDGNVVELSEEQQHFFNEWISLTADEKRLIYQIVKNLNHRIHLSHIAAKHKNIEIQPVPPDTKPRLMGQALFML